MKFIRKLLILIIIGIIVFCGYKTFFKSDAPADDNAKSSHGTYEDYFTPVTFDTGEQTDEKTTEEKKVIYFNNNK